MDEELRELKAEIAQLSLNQAKSEGSLSLQKKVENELGDLLFTLSNLGYLLKINPENALRGTLSKFEKRFRFVERRLKQTGKTPEQSSLAEMDRFWQEAKSLENVEIWGLTGGIASGKSTAAKFFQQWSPRSRCGSDEPRNP